MTYTTILIVLVVELGCIASTAASLHMLARTAGYEAVQEHAERVERAHLPAYLTEDER